jgi:hypothetical protein
MKAKNQSRNKVGALDKIKSQLNKVQQLDSKQMKSICGGEGEDNGGGDIIIPIIKPKS